MLTFSAITRTVSSLMILDELSILSTLSVGAEALGSVSGAVPQPRKSASVRPAPPLGSPQWLPPPWEEAREQPRQRRLPRSCPTLPFCPLLTSALAS